MRALLLSLILLLATAINCYASNKVFITQIDQEGGSVYIKQDGLNNTFGISTDNPFVIDGNKITIIIKQIGNSNETDDTGDMKFKGSNMTFDYVATGDSNKLRLDLPDTDADGQYYDIDVTGNSNIVDISGHTSDDIQDTHICLLYTSPSPRDGLLSRMPSSA